MNRRTVATLTALTLGVAALSGCSSAADPDHSGSHGSASASASAGSDHSGQHSSASPAATPSPTVLSDVEFIQQMIPHHEQALALSKIALDSDSASKQLKALARDIADAQGPEIKTMRGWLAGWDEKEETHSHMSMPGMVGPEQLEALRATGRKDFERTWLQMMIAHHQGALVMASQRLTGKGEEKVTRYATEMAKQQADEIARMDTLLRKVTPPASAVPAPSPTAKASSSATPSATSSMSGM